MANVIKHLRSGTAGAKPTAEEIGEGQIAINYKDKALFILDDTGLVDTVASTDTVTKAASAVQTVNNLSGTDVTLAPNNIGTYGVAPLDATGKVALTNLPPIVGSVNGKVGTDVVLAPTDIGTNGVAPLDATGKVDLINLPPIVESVNGKTGTAVTLAPTDIGTYGVPALDATGKVAMVNLPTLVDSVNGKTGTVTLAPADIGTYGVAPLDSNSKVPLANLPSTILGAVHYMGSWDASTNTPTLPTATAAQGQYYVVGTAGTQFGLDFTVGDWVISDGVNWDKVDTIEGVLSVAGRTGNVVLTATDIASGTFVADRLGATPGNSLMLTTDATGIPTWRPSTDITNQFTAKLAVDLSAGDVTLTLTQWTSYWFFDCTGNTVARTLTVPANPRPAVVKNEGTVAITFLVTGGGSVVVQAAQTVMIYNDGVNATITGGGGTGGGGATAFTALTDTFPSYTGKSGQAIRVNTGETGLESYIPSSSVKLTHVQITSGAAEIDVPGFLPGYRHRIRGVIKNSGTDGISIQVGTGSPVVWQTAANYQSRMWIYNAWRSDMSTDRCWITYFSTSNAENGGDYAIDIDLPNDPTSAIPDHPFAFSSTISRSSAPAGTGYSVISTHGAYSGLITPTAIRFLTSAGNPVLTCDLTLYGEPVLGGADGTAGSGIPEAPIDGNLYGRKNGAWAQSLGGNGNVTLIGSVVLDGTTPSYTFANIPQTYTHLRLLFLGKSGTTGTSYDDLLMQFNGDITANNYLTQRFFADGSNVYADRNFVSNNSIEIGMLGQSGEATNAACGSDFQIPFYSGNVWGKTVNGQVSSHASSTTFTSGGRAFVIGGWWNNTAPITSITAFLKAGGNIAAGSRFALYGISDNSIQGSVGSGIIADLNPTGTNTVSIISIPPVYKTIKIVGIVRSTTTGAGSGDVRVRFNGDTGANYTTQRTFSKATAINAEQQLNATDARVGEVPFAGSYSQLPGTFELTIPFYTETAFDKTFFTKWSNTNAGTADAWYDLKASGYWNNTAAINRIDLTITSGQFASGTHIIVYGVNDGSSGGASKFTDLTDTFSYVGKAGQLLRVRADETGLEPVADRAPFWLPPAASSFATVTGGATTFTLVDDSDVGLQITCAASTTNDAIHFAYRTLTNKTLDWAITSHINFMIGSENYSAPGICTMDSVSGRVEMICFDARNLNARPMWRRMNSLTSWNVDIYTNNSWGSMGWVRWRKVSADNLLYLDMSPDGKTWHTYAQAAPAAWLTNQADRIGVGIYTKLTLQREFVCDYFSLTGPAV